MKFKNTIGQGILGKTGTSEQLMLYIKIVAITFCMDYDAFCCLSSLSWCKNFLRSSTPSLTASLPSLAFSPRSFRSEAEKSYRSGSKRLLTSLHSIRNEDAIEVSCAPSPPSFRTEAKKSHRFGNEEISYCTSPHSILHFFSFLSTSTSILISTLIQKSNKKIKAVKKIAKNDFGSLNPRAVVAFISKAMRRSDNDGLLTTTFNHFFNAFFSRPLPQCTTMTNPHSPL